MEDCGTLSWILSDLWIVKSLPLDDNYIDDDYDDIDDVHDDIDDDDVIDEWGHKIFLGISCALLRLSAWIIKKKKLDFYSVLGFHQSRIWASLSPAGNLIYLTNKVPLTTNSTLDPQVTSHRPLSLVVEFA